MITDRNNYLLYITFLLNMCIYALFHTISKSKLLEISVQHIKGFRIQFIIESEQIVKFCRSSATLLSLTSRNIHEKAGGLTRHLWNRRWIRRSGEATGLKNVLAVAAVITGREFHGRVCYVLPSGSIAINEFGRPPSQESYKETRRLNCNSVLYRLLQQHRDACNCRRME